jgi:DNA-cytosine methyltransferase
MEHFELVTGEDLGARLGVSRSTLWRLRNQGLPTRRVGRALRYSVAEVQHWIRLQMEADPFEPSRMHSHAEQVTAESNQMAMFVDQPSPEAGTFFSAATDLPPCHWSMSVALDPKHRPQTTSRPSSTVRREWWRFPQEAHLVDEEGNKYRRLKSSEIAVLQGFPADWGMKSGLSEHDLIRGYGNAVPPPLAQVLFDAISEMAPHVPKSSLEVCAGFGGLALGASRAGFEHAGLLDFWGPAVQVLKSTGPWSPEVPIHADITNFDWSTYVEKVGVLSGGPPCQPWSRAGQGKGSDDERDLLGLMPEVISKVRPSVFILENVPGLLMGDNEPYAKWLIEKLRSPAPGVKYGCVAGVLNAADFGVPQVRKRVFIVGFLDADVAFAHSFLDAVYHRRTHANPRKVLPKGLKPWVTIAEALPEWECQPSGWRKWINMPEAENQKQELQQTPTPKRPAPSAPVLGLNWPSRGKAFRWGPGHWEVADSPTGAADEEYRPLLINKDSKGRPSIDPWFVTGDPSHSLQSLYRVYGRATKLAYLDAPRLRTDDTSFAIEDQYAKLDTWLTVIRGLLNRAISLLDDDGAIIVLCGTIESPYVELLMNELLGPGNRVGTIAWQKAYGPRNMEGMTEITATHDNLVVFAKRREECLPTVALQVPSDDLTDDGDPRGPWEAEHKGANKPDVSYETHVPPYDWKVKSGSLPPGFWRLCEKSGVLWADAASVNQCGEWVIEIEINDQIGNATSREFKIEVKADAPEPKPTAPDWLIVRRDENGGVSNEVKGGGNLSIVTKDLPPAKLGAAYSAVLIGKGGTPYEGRVRPGAQSRSIIELHIDADAPARQIGRANKTNPIDMTLPDGRPVDPDGIVKAGTQLILTKYDRYWEYTAATLELACATYDLYFGTQKRSSIPAIKRHIKSFKPLNQTSTWVTERGLKREDPKRIGWTEDAKKELQALFGSNLIKEVPKPVISKPSGLIGRLVALFSREGGVVVDIGSPAAELASIACALNRRSIYIELPSDALKREKLTLPRISAAARGDHPSPTGALFGDVGSISSSSFGYWCGDSAREKNSSAAPCIFEVGPVALRVRRDPRIVTLDYEAYKTGSSSFLQMLASLEGLIPEVGREKFPVFATSNNGRLVAAYVSSSTFLTIGHVLSLLRSTIPDSNGEQVKLRIYFHRGLDPREAEVPRNVELRRVPFDLDVIGSRVPG